MSALGGSTNQVLVTKADRQFNRVVGVADYIDEVLQEDCDEREPRREGDDGGITFTAKSPRRYSAWTPCVTRGRLDLNILLQFCCYLLCLK